jgi:signal transduction histidine kinase
MMTIRARLLLLLVPGLLLVLLAGGATVYGVARASLARQLDAGLAARAEALASLVTYDEGRLEFEFDEEQERELGGIYFEYRLAEGTVIRRSLSLGEVTLPATTAARESGGLTNVVLPNDRLGRMTTLLFSPRVDEPPVSLPEASESPHQLLVVVAVERDTLDGALATLRRTLLAVEGVFAVVCMLLVATGVRWALRPLERLSQTVGSIEADTLTDRTDVAHVPGELVPVYQELNSMLARVERALERERTFADAAAHELRTPLTELLSVSEVALRFPDEERTRGALREALEIGREMQRLVETLLVISRGHIGTASQEAPRARPGPLVSELLTKELGRLEAPVFELTTEVPDEAELPVEPGVLRMILRNLLDNALTYTPSGGSIRVSANLAEDGRWTVRVENGPVALGPQEIPHLFHPFWQHDEARASRLHVGLGLTVVQRLAALSQIAVVAGLEGDRLWIQLEPTRPKENGGATPS